MDRKFELRQGDVLTVYVKANPGEEPIDSFTALARKIKDGVVEIVEIDGKSASHYEFKVGAVERGRIGYMEFEQVSAQAKGQSMDDILRDTHGWLE